MAKSNTPLTISPQESQFLLELGWSPEAVEIVSRHAAEPKMVVILNRLLREFPGRGQRLRSKSPRKTADKAKIPNALRTIVFERDAYRCRECGDWHDLSVDHIIPESRGGTLDLANLQTLCKSCNSRKGAR